MLTRALLSLVAVALVGGCGDDAMTSATEGSSGGASSTSSGSGASESGATATTSGGGGTSSSSGGASESSGATLTTSSTSSTGGSTSGEASSGSTSGDPSTSGSTGGTTGAACIDGEVVCEEGGAATCEGGVLGAPTPCDDACVDGLGCVLCVPGDKSCDGDDALVCAEDGQSWGVTDTCDALQGIFCNPDFGACDGVCAPDNLQLDYLGCDYYPTVTMQLDGWNGGTKIFAVTVANTAKKTTNVTVTRAGKVVATAKVDPESVKMIALPWIPELTKGTGPTALVKGGAYRLRADNPVTVVQFNPLLADFTNDAALLLPVNAWDDAAMVAAAPHWISGQDPQVQLPGFYAVVASEDGTTVKLLPGALAKVQAGAGVAANGSGEVLLNAGDVLQVLSDVGGDLTGARVTADRPIQVIAGHKCTNVPADVDACDHLEEAMFPLSSLGKTYLVAPPVQSPNDKLEKAQVVRVIAAEDDTTLVFTPDQGVQTKLAKAGDFVELAPSTARYRVSGDKRILVAQYMVGQAGGYGQSDPAMVLAVAVDQYRESYLFHAPTTWASNYVDVIAPDGAAVTVDGAAVGGFTPIPGTGFGLAHVKLSNQGDGNHTLSASAKVGIAIYGVQSFGSYWTVGGLDLEHF